MVWVSGADGCRSGWFCVSAEWHQGRVRCYQGMVVNQTLDILALQPQPAALAIDMPIGLSAQPQPGGRKCDRAARRYLGRRGVCVFSPPARGLLEAASFDEVRGRGMTIQGFHLIPKIRELDQIMNPDRQNILFEAHPECAFARLAGRPLVESKRTRSGRSLRQALLAPIFPCLDSWLDNDRPAGVAPDDQLDALVLCWVAHCFSTGTAHVFPDEIERDERGLAMQIWY